MTLVFNVSYLQGFIILGLLTKKATLNLKIRRCLCWCVFVEGRGGAGVEQRGGAEDGGEAEMLRRITEEATG